MKETATSRYNLNADFGLSYPNMLKWIIYNYLNNRNGDVLSDSRIQIMKHAFNIDNWERVDSLASPARRLCDFFWMDLNWKNIQFQLGSKIAAIEIGCGTGVYGSLISEILGEKLNFYRGIDINENKEWKKFENDPKFQFSVGNASTIQKDLIGINFIFTQSALEHFEEDLSFFQQIADYVNNAVEPMVQVHLMPSKACISTFPWHGFRQYTNASVSKITRLFTDESTFEFVSLGGKACNSVHRNYITKPIYLKKGDQRKTKNSEYNNALRSAILKDNSDSSNSEATFVALIIRTRCTKR